MRAIIDNIIYQFMEVLDGKTWIGTNFNRHLNLIDENDAFRRPMPDLHSVAEIIAHLIVWRKETILKIRTGVGSITDDCAENWLPNEKLRQIGWNRIKTDFRESLFELVEILKTKGDDFLLEKYYDTDFKGYYQYKFVIHGMLHHDIYHLGQLGIIVRFLKKSLQG